MVKHISKEVFLIKPGAGAVGRRGGRGAFPCMGCMESAVTWRGAAGRRGAPRRPTLVLPKTRVLNGELLVRCVM